MVTLMDADLSRNNSNRTTGYLPVQGRGLHHRSHTRHHARLIGAAMMRPGGAAGHGEVLSHNQRSRIPDFSILSSTVDWLCEA
jgi:hypothetical protein